MPEKRRLPVVSNAPAGPPDEEQPPPWHWVPIGAIVIIAVAAVLGRSFFYPYAQRQVERVYGTSRDPAELARIHQHLSTQAIDALRWRLMLAALPVAFVSVAVGGVVVVRFGSGTNARHGTLAGITAMALLVLFAGRGARSVSEVIAYATLVPFGGIVGYLGGRVGESLRARKGRS